MKKIAHEYSSEKPDLKFWNSVVWKDHGTYGYTWSEDDKHLDGWILDFCYVGGMDNYDPLNADPKRKTIVVGNIEGSKFSVPVNITSQGNKYTVTVTGGFESIYYEKGTYRPTMMYSVIKDEPK
jgi:hypothetical protein